MVFIPPYTSASDITTLEQIAGNMSFDRQLIGGAILLIGGVILLGIGAIISRQDQILRRLK